MPKQLVFPFSFYNVRLLRSTQFCSGLAIAQLIFFSSLLSNDQSLPIFQTAFTLMCGYVLVQRLTKWSMLYLALLNIVPYASRGDMCMLTSTVSLAFFEGILDYLEQRESGRQEMLAQEISSKYGCTPHHSFIGNFFQKMKMLFFVYSCRIPHKPAAFLMKCSRILCCSSIRTPQEINNLRFLNRPLSRWVKVTPFSGMWDRDLMFLQARQILKDFTDTSISSNGMVYLSN
uniref:Uncharacterized protein n=1 Tax=Ditylenchus dipsaci TaxID=166011 RepID=A0A915ETC6_9BILA